MFYRGLNEEIDIYNNHVYLYFLFCFVNVLVCEIWGSRFWMTLHFFHLLPQLSNQETPVNEWVKRSGSGSSSDLFPCWRPAKVFFYCFMNTPCNQYFIKIHIICCFFAHECLKCALLHIWRFHCFFFKSTSVYAARDLPIKHNTISFGLERESICYVCSK